MTFEILTPTDATLNSVMPRTEKHGDDTVFAISLGLKITGSNTMLDNLAPGLRDALYKAVEGQEQLPGVEPSTPLLRTKLIEKVDLANCYEGWTISIDHGIDENDPIKLGGAKVDKFRVVPHEGGSVDLLFRVGSNDIDANEAGLLCSHLGQGISITLTAPEARKPDAVIDGSVGHPGVAAQAGDTRDATDLFAAGTEGDPGEGDPDEFCEEGEGSQTDPGAAEQAEIEAGMSQSLAIAGVKPKRGGRRVPAAGLQ